MTKFFNRWLRKIHRWIAVPTAILIPIAVVIKFSGRPDWQVVLKQFDSIQSLLMLALAITGAYLYLLPYITKWQRKQRQRIKAS
jgi:hypothetical protein